MRGALAPTPSDLAITRRHAFGRRVRALRTADDVSQEALAERAGLHRTYVSSVERGERNISLNNIYALADALGVEVSALFEEGEGSSGNSQLAFARRSLASARPQAPRANEIRIPDHSPPREPAARRQPPEAQPRDRTSSGHGLPPRRRLTRCGAGRKPNPSVPRPDDAVTTVDGEGHRPHRRIRDRASRDDPEAHRGFDFRSRRVTLDPRATALGAVVFSGSSGAVQNGRCSGLGEAPRAGGRSFSCPPDEGTWPGRAPRSRTSRQQAPVVIVGGRRPPVWKGRQHGGLRAGGSQQGDDLR